MGDFLWWRDGVIYQIYPRSFADSNDDGIGDLNGIIAHLDYLSDLGVDAIWLSPIYPSPDKDFGYDVSDYINIDPKYGTMGDFDRLVAETHERGLRLIMDMVMNHTSNIHPWFLESHSSRKNPKHDWYIWMKGYSKNQAPNNWQAAFGGSAWEYDPVCDQYYLHSFAKEQPDVNWRNPDVRKAQLSAFKFWMDRGVDGFRLDVFNAYFKHPDFPNNSPKLGIRSFDRQNHVFDMDQPEMMPLLHDLRKLLDSYPERYAVGETYMATLDKVISYCGDDKLHSAFSFDFTNKNLFFPWNPTWIKRVVSERDKGFSAANAWPTTVLSNHDLPRAASRYSKGDNDALARLALGLLLTLRGTPFIYYGEEIGMRDIHLSYSQIVDPAGKMYWPLYKGRDGCRSPMQWNSNSMAGFSRSKPWLPVHPDYMDRNVSAQKADRNSLFYFTKSILTLRKKYAALQKGTQLFLKSPPGTLEYLRTHGIQSLLVLMNFTSRSKSIELPDGAWNDVLARFGNKSDKLGPYEFRLLVKE
jgi:alpha-glucosidase